MSRKTVPLSHYQRYLNSLPLASRNKTHQPLPAPLLARLAQPITSLGELDVLVQQLNQARARGCF